MIDNFGRIFTKTTLKSFLFLKFLRLWRLFFVFVVF